MCHVCQHRVDVVYALLRMRFLGLRNACLLWKYACLNVMRSVDGSSGLSEWES